MNHHSFRELVKELPAKYLKENRMNPAHFKAVCFVLSMYGDYETGTSIRPSWLTVAREAGVDRKTAMKVRDFLIDNGLLVKIRTNEANISVYNFGDARQLSILDEQLSNSSEQMSTIVGQNTTIYTTSNTTEKEEVSNFIKGVFS